jgi:hypothetical protein
VSGIRIKVFAEHTCEDLERKANYFLARSDVKYIDHRFITDGLEKPYNMTLAYRAKKSIFGLSKKEKQRKFWRRRVFGR